jgi:hypothetical protein
MILPFAAGGASDLRAPDGASAVAVARTAGGDREYRRPLHIFNAVWRRRQLYAVMVSNALAIGETMSPKRGYLLMREFTPITQLNALSLVLVTNPKLPVKSVAELIALAKAQPGKLNYASSGVGSIYHLPMEHLKSMAKIDIQHVPYKSSSQARMDVIAGEPAMMMDALATMQGQIKENQVRAIGVAAPADRSRSGYSGDRRNGSRYPAMRGSASWHRPARRRTSSTGSNRKSPRCWQRPRCEPPIARRTRCRLPARPPPSARSSTTNRQGARPFKRRVPFGIDGGSRYEAAIRRWFNFVEHQVDHGDPHAAPLRKWLSPRWWKTLRRPARRRFAPDDRGERELRPRDGHAAGRNAGSFQVGKAGIAGLAGDRTCQCAADDDLREPAPRHRRRRQGLDFVVHQAGGVWRSDRCSAGVQGRAVRSIALRRHDGRAAGSP